MKNQHDGDCSIYSVLENGSPEDGICTCGYGLQLLRKGDFLEVYSEELLKRLEEENKLVRIAKEPLNLGPLFRKGEKE